MGFFSFLKKNIKFDKGFPVKLRRAHLFIPLLIILYIRVFWVFFVAIFVDFCPVKGSLTRSPGVPDSNE